MIAPQFFADFEGLFLADHFVEWFILFVSWLVLFGLWQR